MTSQRTAAICRLREGAMFGVVLHNADADFLFVELLTVPMDSAAEPGHAASVANADLAFQRLTPGDAPMFEEMVGLAVIPDSAAKDRVAHVVFIQSREDQKEIERGVPVREVIGRVLGRKKDE